MWVTNPDTGYPRHENDYFLTHNDLPDDPSNVIDNFEDGNLVEYIATDPVDTWIAKRLNHMQGNYMLAGRGERTGYNSWLISDLSLPNLPTRGDTFAFNWEARTVTSNPDNAKFFVMWANQNAESGGIHDHYAFEIEVAGDEVDVEYDDGGTDVSLGDQSVSLANYTPYRTIIHWDTDGSGRHRLQIRNRNSGNLICDYWSDADTRFDNGGIGFYVRHGLDVWIDSIVNLSV